MKQTKAELLAQLAKTQRSLEEDVRLARLALEAKEKRLADFVAALPSAKEALLTDRRGTTARSPMSPNVVKTRLPRNDDIEEFAIRVLNDGLARSPALVLVAARKIGYESTASPASQSTMMRAALGRLAKAGTLRKAGQSRYAKA